MDGIYMTAVFTLLLVTLTVIAVVMLAVKKMHESVMTTNMILNHRLQSKMFID